jgi:pimeloyl-ACP methyl ester carboxylesterase
MVLELAHLPIVRLPNQPAVLEVKFIASTEPDGSAILFIHGFNGSAIETWMDFEKMLPESGGCRRRDLFFVGYDALRSDLTASAGIFRDFLDRFFEKPADLLSGAIPTAAKRANNFTYRSLLIVGHSLGAIIARRALLDATLMNKAWPSSCRLCLFAPAHRGARVTELAMEALSFWSFIKPFSAFLRFQSPLIDQLRRGSDTLKTLHDETMEATRNGANPHLKAVRVLIAQYERIVDNIRFANDPPAITIAAKSHINLCKPNRDFQEPVDHVLSCL